MSHGGNVRACACAIACSGALACQFSAIGASTYYVDPLGNDSRPGSAALPWKTLQHAADLVNDGDRVIVRPGNYRGFYLDDGGTMAAPIQFLAEPGALINLPNTRTGRDGINLEQASHVVIDGFAVTGMTRAGVRAVGAEDDPAEFVTVRNVRAYNNGTWGIFTGFVDDLLIERNETSGSADEHGIYVSNSGDRPTIRNNYSWGNHGSGIHMNGDESLGGDGLISEAIVVGNRIVNNALNGGGGSGINMDGVQDSLIANNLVYNNHASGISLYRIDGAEGSSGNCVVNNTVHQPSDGRWALNIQSESTDNIVLNNILVTNHSYRGAIDVSDDSLDGLLSDYNVVTSRFTIDGGDRILNRAAWQTETAQDAHSVTTTTPATLFMNAAGGDYRLRSGSLAIDRGTNASLRTTDMAGFLRPLGAYDAGALEYTARWADLNNSGSVSGSDLSLWETGFGAAVGASVWEGDVNRDGRSDGADFLDWQRQLGSGSAAFAASRPIPEPAAYSLIAWVAIALLKVRKTGSLILK